MTSYFPDEAREPQTPRLAPGRGQHEPEPRARSPWLPLLFKGLALTAGAIVLAGIGAVSGRPATIGGGSARQEAGVVQLGGSDWLAGAELGTVSAAATASAAPSAAPPSATPPAKPEAPVTAPPASGVTQDGKIILNTADATTLCRLPGIGQRRADAIIALRAQLRGFRKLSDLLRVKGIGPKGLRRMLPLLVLNPEPEAAPSATQSGQPHATPK